MNSHRVVTRKSCNHVLHLILTLLSAGLWAPVWILCAIAGRKEVTHMPAMQMQPVWAAHQARTPEWQWNPYANRWEPRR